MACKMEPRLDQNGEPIKWNPEHIPPSKPFIKIVTSAYEPMTTFNNMRFVKTRSLIFTPFHKEARYINFEVGYSQESKWLEFVSDKWANFANFFVVGFLEAIYTAIENGSPITYVQIDAKIIDYDARFRHPSKPIDNHSTPFSSPTTNIFAQRRSSGNSPNTKKSAILRNNSIIMEDAGNNYSDKEDEEGEEEEEGVEGEEGEEGKSQDVIMINDEESTRTTRSYKSFKSQESQEQEQQTSPITTAQSSSNQISTPTRQRRKRQLSDLCDMIDEPNQPIDETNQSYNKRGGGGRGRGVRGVRRGRRGRGKKLL